MYKIAKDMKHYGALIKRYWTATNNLNYLLMWYTETSIPSSSHCKIQNDGEAYFSSIQWKESEYEGEHGIEKEILHCLQMRSKYRIENLETNNLFY